MGIVPWQKKHILLLVGQVVGFFSPNFVSRPPFSFEQPHHRLRDSRNLRPQGPDISPSLECMLTRKISSTSSRGTLAYVLKRARLLHCLETPTTSTTTSYTWGNGRLLTILPLSSDAYLPYLSQQLETDTSNFTLPLNTPGGKYNSTIILIVFLRSHKEKLCRTSSTRLSNLSKDLHYIACQVSGNMDEAAAVSLNLPSIGR